MDEVRVIDHNHGAGTTALPVHKTDLPGAFSNPERVITVRVRGHLSDDGYGIGGRLVTALDENGNPYQIVGLAPGAVRSCPACHRLVYIPDDLAEDTQSIAGDRTIRCPYRSCEGQPSLVPQFGEQRLEDEPGRVIAGKCPDHGYDCAVAEASA